MTATKSGAKVSLNSEDVFEDNETPCPIKDKDNVLKNQVSVSNTIADPVAVTAPTTIGSPAMAAEAIDLTAEDTTPGQKVVEIDDKAKKTCTDILSTELIDLNSKNSAITEIIQAKELSPKKTTPKFIPLVSASGLGHF